MEKVKVSKDDILEKVVYDVENMTLNFDLILEQARANSHYVYVMISSVYTLMHLKRELKKENPAIELKTIPTSYGATRLDVMADSIELDLDNDIRTLVGINGLEIQPIFFSISSLIEIGAKFNLEFYSFNNAETLVSCVKSAKSPVLTLK